MHVFFYFLGGAISDLGDIDGFDMWVTFEDEKANSPRDEVLLHHDTTRQAGSLRVGDMKLILGLSAEEVSDWYGPSGLEESYYNDTFDEWVWKNGSIIKDILADDGYWFLEENSTWRQDASIICGENFLPVSGRCDYVEGPCLYNITDDPCEYKNLAKLYPEVGFSIL